MATFLLHSDKNPEHDMLFVDPCVVEAEDEKRKYAEEFTEVVHETGHEDDQLIPLADAVIAFANQS